MTFVETSRKIAGIGGKMVEAVKGLFDPVPITYSYRGVAKVLFEEAREEWYGSSQATSNPHPYLLRPFEVQFDPKRFYIANHSTSDVQRVVTRELFTAFQGLLPSSEEAFSYQVLHPQTRSLANISCYGSRVKRYVSRGGDMVLGMIIDAGRYGVGILESDSKARLVLFPPGYNHRIGYTKKGISRAFSDFDDTYDDYDKEIKLSPKGPFPAAKGEIIPISWESIGIALPIDPNPQRCFRHRQVRVIEDESYWEVVGA